MKLFLTSSPCDNQVPSGCPLPCIFFSRNRFTENLLRWVDVSRPCVMFASNPTGYARNDLMGETFRECFAWHGMRFPRLTIVDSRNESDVSALLRDCGTVLLGGGHVPTQNAFFQRMKLPTLLKGFDGVVMGISAGSMNCCTEVYAQPEEAGEAVDPGYHRFIPGLGLTDIMILPHYNMVHDYRVDGLHLFRDISIPDSHGRTFYVLNDGSYVLTDGSNAELYGEAWRIRNGVMEKICEEEGSVTLPVG